MTQPTTKKAARETGLRTTKEWLSREDLPDGTRRSRVIPRRDATPIRVKGRGRFSRTDCEEVISNAEAKRRGLSVLNDAEAVKRIRSFSFHKHYWLYRLSDCVPRRVVTVRKPERSDPLAAEC